MRIRRVREIFSKIVSPRAAAWDNAPDSCILTKKKKGELQADTSLSTSLRTMQTTWGLLSSYWRSDRKYQAYTLASAMMGMTVGQVFLEAATIPYWTEFFSNAIDKNLNGIAVNASILGALILATAGISAGRHYLTQALHMNWRGWLTRQFTKAWSANGAYYHIANIPHKVDNPDLTMSDNLNELPGNVIGLVEGGIRASVSVVTFTAIMYSMSDKIAGNLFGYDVALPGNAFMLGFGVALATALAGTWIKYRLGYDLIKLQNEQLSMEGNLRSTLVDIRDHADEIAAYDGEAIENRRLSRAFGKVVGNWYHLMLVNAKLLMFDEFYNNSSKLFSYGVGAAAQTISTSMVKGSFSGFAETFEKLRLNLSWFVTVFPALFRVKALSNRLTTLAQHIEQTNSLREFYEKEGLPADIQDRVHDHGSIVLSDLKIVHPTTMKNIIDVPHLEIPQGSRMALVGDSGSGKSILLRTIRGLWKYGSGDVRIPEGKKLFFAFQMPRIINNYSLKENICYPEPSEKFSDAKVERVLEMAGLREMIPHLHDAERNQKSWGSLSQGEKQRLVFARIFLHKPDIVFLDESTSAMDPALQDRMYETLLRELPDATVISVVHRRKAVRFHNDVVRIESGGIRVISYDEFMAEEEQAAKAEVKAPEPSI